MDILRRSRSHLRRILGRDTGYPLLESLVAYWPMTEDGEADRADLGPNSITLTPEASIGRAAGLVYEYAADWTDDAAELQAPNPPALVFGHASFTVLQWIYTYSMPPSPGYRGLFQVNGSWADGDYTVKIPYNDKVAWLVDAGSNQVGVTHTPTGTLVDTWAMITTAHDGENDVITARHDLGAIQELEWTKGSGNPAGVLRIGGDWGNYNGDQRIGPVMVFGRILTEAEYTWLYNSGAGRTYAEIAAYQG